MNMKSNSHDLVIEYTMIYELTQTVEARVVSNKKETTEIFEAKPFEEEIYIEEEIHDFVQQTIGQEIMSFPNPGILLLFYSVLNLGIRNHCILRKHMGDLADLIIEQTSKLRSLNEFSSNFTTTLNEDIIKVISLEQYDLL